MNIVTAVNNIAFFSRILVTVISMLLAFTVTLKAQVTKGWHKTWQGTGVVFPTDQLTDQEGNIYLAGQFEGTVDFDPGPQEFKLKESGLRDNFIIKLSSSGKLLWAKRIGNELSDKEVKICLTPEGAIYVAGIFQGVMDFDPGPGVITLEAPYKTDLFVLKLNKQGDFIWVKRAGSPLSTEFCFGVAGDKNNNVYVTGSFSKTADFDPGPGVNELTASGSTSGFLLAISKEGNALWARSFGSKGVAYTTPKSLCIDDVGNITVAGHFNGSGDFDPGAETRQLTADKDGGLFIGRFNVSGEMQWVVGSSLVQGGNEVLLAPDKQGHVWVALSFKGTMDADPGDRVLTLSGEPTGSAFINLDQQGSCIQAFSFGTGAGIMLKSVSLNKEGSLDVTGTFEGKATFGSLTTTSKGTADIFIARLKKDGTISWCKLPGGEGHDSGGVIRNTADGLLLISGNTGSDHAFANFTGIPTPVSKGMFLLKYPVFYFK